MWRAEMRGASDEIAKMRFQAKLQNVEATDNIGSSLLWTTQAVAECLSHLEDIGDTWHLKRFG